MAEDLRMADAEPIKGVSTSWVESGVKSYVRLHVTYVSGRAAIFPIFSHHQLECSYIILANYIFKNNYFPALKSFYLEYGSVKFSMRDVKQYMEHQSIGEATARTSFEVWPGKRNTNESLIDFVKRVWGSQLARGLDMAQLRKIDAKLVEAIKAHKKAGLPWPSHLEIATQKSRLMLAETRLMTEGVDALTPNELEALARKRKRKLAASGPTLS